MSVKNFACFDLYPTTMQSALVPTSGGGIAGTPLESFIRAAATNTNSSSVAIGVSDNPAQGFAMGNTTARALVMHKSSTSALANYFTLGNGAGSTLLNHADNAGKTYREVIGFAFKWSPNGSTSTAAFQVLTGARYVGSSVPTGNNYSLVAMAASTGKLVVNGMATDRDFNADQEYYIEAVLECNHVSGSSNTAKIQIWIDGELINEREYSTGGSTSATANLVYFQWRLGLSETTSRALQQMYAHFYHLSKGFNESPTAPFDNRLGPQKVRLAPVKSVTENQGWETVGAADPVAAWSLANFGNDAAYVQSPVDNGQLSVQLQLPTNATSKIHGLSFYGRTQREGQIARALNVSFSDQGVTPPG